MVFPCIFWCYEQKSELFLFHPFHSYVKLSSCFTLSYSCHPCTLLFAHSLSFITFLVLLQTPEVQGRAIPELNATLGAWASCGFTKQNSITYFAGFSVLSACVTAVEHFLFCFKVLLMIIARFLFLVATANSFPTAVSMASVVVFSMCVTSRYHCNTKADEIPGIINFCNTSQ